MTTTRLLQLHLLFRNPNIEDDDVIVERVAQVPATSEPLFRVTFTTTTLPGAPAFAVAATITVSAIAAAAPAISTTPRSPAGAAAAFTVAPHKKCCATGIAAASTATPQKGWVTRCCISLGTSRFRTGATTAARAANSQRRHECHSPDARGPGEYQHRCGSPVVRGLWGMFVATSRGSRPRGRRGWSLGPSSVQGCHQCCDCAWRCSRARQ